MPIRSQMCDKMRTLIVLLLNLLVRDGTSAQTMRPLPVIQTIGEGIVWRQSLVKDQHANSQSRWNAVTITNVFGFKKKPVVGKPVTVLTLGLDISPFDLRILKAAKQEDGCDESLPPWWEVEFEPVKQRRLFEVSPPPDRSTEYPFDVVMLYPAVKGAQLIKHADLNARMLPKGVYLKTVKAAIDL